MPFASVLSATPTRALFQRLLAFLLVVAGLCLVGAAHAGTIYTFNGGDRLGCKSKGKVYTCDSLQLPAWDDRMVIADGYTVNVASSVGFGWNHGLRMAGTARLTSTGNINLTTLAPGNLAIDGGSFDAGGTFSVGGPAPFTADVSAGSLTLGAGSAVQITGKMVSRGTVTVMSHTTVVGPVSGTAITINSHYTITGAVTASDTLLVNSNGTIDGPVSGTNSVTIRSHNVVTGTVTSQGNVTFNSDVTIGGAVKGSVVTADAGVRLKNDVTATSRFTLGSASTVAGDVDTGQLTLYASDAAIGGNAKVDFATLFYHGRVEQKIYCKKGTRPGYCDCVDNQSHYAVNTAEGPRCEAVKPPATGLSHFLIVHDGSAGTCAPEYVTVKACANGDCSTLHNGGATLTMAPGGQTVVIDASGVNTRAEVSSIATGKINLSLTQGSAKPTFECLVGNTKSCVMDFTGGVNLSIRNIPDHKAGNKVSALIKAVKANDNETACVPAFTGLKSVQYSCDYVLPSSGGGKMELTTNEGANGAFACNESASLSTRFDTKGEANVDLSYVDAGKVALKASVEPAKGRQEFIVAPNHFTLEAVKPLRAGLSFTVKLAARNAKGEVTPNFHGDALPKDATLTEVAFDCIASGVQGSLPTVATGFSKGEASATLSYSEAGYLDLRATHAKFLGSAATNLITTGTTGGAANGKCKATTGPFVPAYFQVELKDDKRKKTNFFYSGEPIPLKLSAMNAQGQVTKNYPAGHGSGDVIKFSAVQVDGTAAPGAVSGTFEARHFVSGEAPLAGTPFASPIFKFTDAKHAPLQIRLRADNESKGQDTNLRITSAYSPGEPEQARPFIRTGRLRLGKRFGRVGAQALDMPVTVEFWSGNSWVRNTQDSFTVIPGAAFAQSPGSAGAAKPSANSLPAVTIMNGAGKLPVTGDAPGWIDIAVNLGPDKQDTSCLPAHPASSGGAQAWLRSPVDCNGQWGSPVTDPAARATFGIFPAENRRLIHVREVFN